MGLKNVPEIIEVRRNGGSVLVSLTRIWNQFILAKIGGKETIFLLKIPSSNKIGYKYSFLKQLSLSNDSHLYKYSALIKIIRIIKENLADNITTTVRDIYYRDVVLFQRNQIHAAKIINDLAFSLDVTPEDGLQIAPGQKGLVYGALSIKNSHGNLFDFNEPGLIPILTTSYLSEFKVIRGQPKAIIILEKEAVFKSICKELKNQDHNFIVITGKGFPCRLTKKFIALLVYHFADIPIFAFVDSDIYGIQICANYLASIQNNYHDSGINEDEKLLRKKTSPACFTYAGVFLLEYKTGWLDITSRDWKRMQNFLIQSKVNCQSNGKLTEDILLQEVSRGMIFRKKCEMNCIYEKYLDYVVKKVNKNLHSDYVKL
ncbi:hypothetical protein CLIB1423_02S09538 [[Candida] railenensis]|uniref:DNA topoisomerase (ATP-hydrolyzing) n=1 Tax=[Candida] railenensis TaxID=45579 RepID=A0A9P0QLR6_9ASCO|nr:hypothetical protein CLIB1423_02S09538 [[Candida] railenensis]